MNNKSDFGTFGGTYCQGGDYLIPNLKLPAEEKDIHIGVWGMRRKNYLLKNRKTLFGIMLSNGTLWKHLAETDKQAEEIFSRLVNDMARAEGVTEELKETDQMAWVGAMNNIRQSAMEFVNIEIIFAQLFAWQDIFRSVLPFSVYILLFSSICVIITL